MRVDDIRCGDGCFTGTIPCKERGSLRGYEVVVACKAKAGN